MNVLKVPCVIVLLCVVLGMPGVSWSESPYFAGTDLSWVNELEDRGAKYRVNGELRDVWGANS